ncbi:MAG: hypothetical protein H7125_04310 [Proteobacteria bacterium]|nr:hypothetical protein [Burkholderiales bacterium]
MPELRFFDPSGSLEISQQHAPRLSTLAGKRIALLANGEWQSVRSLAVLKESLEQDFPGIDVLPPEHFPEGNAVLSEPATLERLRKAEVDAVIIGNAA